MKRIVNGFLLSLCVFHVFLYASNRNPDHPDIALEPSSKNYGEVAVGSESSHTFVVSNTGVVDLHVSEVKFLHEDTDQFRIDSGGGSFILIPGGSREVVVSFVPTSGGSKLTHLKFYSNDPDENPKWATLSGKGIGEGGDPDIGLEPGSKNYGEVAVGSDASHTFEVCNEGSADLHVSEVKFVHEDTDQFRIDSGGGAFILTPGGSREVVVSFVPTSGGSKMTHLKFYSNDPDENPKWATLSGVGIGADPDIVIEPASKNYGEVEVGTDAMQRFTVSNAGSSELNVSEVKLLGGNTDQFRIDSGAGSFNLVPGETQDIVVSFVPTSNGYKSTHLKVYSDDPDENPKWATLSGKGLGADPDIALDPESYEFGEVTVGSDASHVFTVSNEGNADLHVSEVKFVGGNADQFRIDSGGGSFTLTPGGSHEVVVGFVPTSNGSKETLLKFYSDDPDENPKWATLSGKGLGVDPDIALSPESLIFGQVDVGSTASLTLVVANKGDSDLHVSEVKFVGGNTDQFHIDGGGGSFDLVPGATREVVVKFIPTSNGYKNTHLKFFSNDPDENPIGVKLSGIGEGGNPDIALNPGTTDFGSVSVGLSASHSFSVSNYGVTDLHVTEVKITGDHSDEFHIVSGGGAFILPPSYSRQVVVSFMPNSSGIKSVQLKVYSNDPDENPVWAELSGSTPDTQSPLLSYNYPVSNSQSVPKNTKIQFEIKDPGNGAGINLGSVDVSVNGEAIIMNGIVQTGHHVEISWYGKKLKVVYESSSDFEEGSVVTVIIHCLDLCTPPNVMDKTYIFTICGSKTTVTATDTVDQNGGVVTCNTTEIEISIPSGALSDTTEITIAGVDEVPELPNNVEGIGVKYHFGPDGLQFNNTVTIRIPFTWKDLLAAGVSHPMDLEIYYYHTSSGEWVKLTVAEADDHFLYVLVDQFCYLNITKSSATGMDEGQNQILPSSMILEQNYPNPFNPETHIGFQVPAASPVQIDIFNSTGKKIRTLVNETMSAGQHDVVWDGRDDWSHLVSSGLYFCVMRSRDFKQTRRMIFTK